MAKTTITQLPAATTLTEEQVLPVEDNLSTKKMTLNLLTNFFKNKFNSVYAPIKSNTGSWVMSNGLWVPGYTKAEADNLLSAKFAYKSMPPNTNPITLLDGAYKWTWNSGGIGMPFVLSGAPAECACVVINGSRTLSIRRAVPDSTLEFRYSGQTWHQTSLLVKSFSGATKLTIGAGANDSWSTSIVGFPEDVKMFITHLRITYTATNNTNCQYGIFSGSAPTAVYSLQSTPSNRQITDTITFIGDGRTLTASFLSGNKKQATLEFNTAFYFPILH